MGLVGREIIQTRTYIDPSVPKPPNLNYKETFPITVIDAIRADIDENSPKLSEILDKLHQELINKQPIFSAKPANYIMTFAGKAGEVGGIPITREISWDPNLQRHDKIPTERAVGELLYKLGLVDSNGEADSDGGKKIRWYDIIGRPILYTDLGMNEDGVVIQKVVTTAINNITDQLELITSDIGGRFNILTNKIDNHTLNNNNPHNITLDQLGAASTESLEFHTNNIENPHNVKPIHLNLEKVDNTADMDKPISSATQEALNIINDTIKAMDTELTDLHFIVDGNYHQASGTLTLILRNGSTITMHIPIDGLVDKIIYDKDTKELVVYELGGVIDRIDISDLFIRYIGHEGTHITVEIDGDQITGDQIIKASINVKSITNNEMANDSVVTRMIKEKNVTTSKIRDLAITTIKLADGSVTTEKIAELSITTSRLGDRAVTGKKMFSSILDNRVLAILTAGEDPIWLQVNSEMIAPDAVRTTHILNQNVTSDKLKDGSVINNKIDINAVTTDKIMNLTITNEKIANSTITGTKLVNDTLFMGTPRMTQRPMDSARNNQIPDTAWVKDRIDQIQIRNDNLLNRVVDGRVLFSSPHNNKALVVLSADSNPTWGLINNSMMDVDSVQTENIVDLNITAPKLDNSSIISRHISKKAVLNDHINEGAVTSTKLWKSESANRVIASLTNDSYPVYTQITGGMVKDNAIGTNQIEDRSVIPSKLGTSDQNHRILGVVLKNTDPVWMQVVNGMLGNRSVDGRVLFSSSFSNRILGVTAINEDPAWLQINSEMIQNRAIKKDNIAFEAIHEEHLQEKIIESRHIVEKTIQSNDIAPRAITGTEMFTSPNPNRVLAITTKAYSDPAWLQVATDMIEDKAISKEKIFQSTSAYRVLGVTQPDVPPEYIKITSDFIVDDSIIPQKLVRDFVLYGTPELTVRPSPNAENRQLPDTTWVRQCMADTMKNFNPKILYDTVTTEMLAPRAIDGTKLMTHPYAPRVIGITHPNEDPEFLLIEEDLIVDGAVTQNKLQRDITLMGSPKVEVRPSPYASDRAGGGQLIPDCQWVLDAILAGGSSGGGGTIVGGSLIDGSVTSNTIANRAVTADKIFTSITPNRLLGVLNSNTNPQYLRAINEMISDRAIDGRTLFTSGIPNRILGITTANTNPAWVQVNYEMMASNSIGNLQIRDDSISTHKINDYAVTQIKLEQAPIIDNIRLVDNSVTTTKISNFAVENDKIANSTIRGEKLVDNIVLPGHPTVPSSSSYETRSLRNAFLSPNAPKPTDGENGDLWFRYI